MRRMIGCGRATAAPPRVRRTTSLSTLMILLGVLVGSACSSQPQRSDVQPAPVLQTTPAVNGIVRPSETLSGIIAPIQNVQISNTLAEPVASVLVQEGQVVQRGHVLAVLETQDLEANLKAAQKITMKTKQKSARHDTRASSPLRRETTRCGQRRAR